MAAIGEFSKGGMPYIALLLLWDLLVMGLYALDKRRVQTKKRRIREQTLLLCAFLGGGIGAFLACCCFVTRQGTYPFRILLPIACLLTIVFMAALLGLG